MVNQPKTHFKLKHSSSTILEAVLRSSEGEPYLAGPTPDYRWTHAMRGDGNKLTKAEFFDENEPGQPFLFLTLNPEQKSEPLSVSPLRPADVKLKRVALQKCKVVVGYGQFAYDKTRIIPVIDGVCCAPILSEDIPGSLEFHVALDRPKTDISGLRLVLEDEELDAVVNDLAVLGETVLERLDESPFAEYAPVTWLEDFVDEASALS